MCGELYYRIVIAGLWTETALYGLYTAIFFISVYIFARDWAEKKRFLLVSIVMYTICTGLVVMDLVDTLLSPNSTAHSRIVGTSISYCDATDSGAGETAAENQEDILYDLYEPITTVLFAINLFVADALLIYRCSVLWRSRKSVIVVPSVLLLGSIVCNILQVVYQTKIYHLRRKLRPQSFDSSPEWNESNSMDRMLSQARYILTLATNVVTTLLIAGRVWWLVHEIDISPGRKMRGYRSTIMMIGESGAIYSTSLIIVLILDYIAPAYCTIAYPAMEQIMGIAPTLIMVRVGLGKSFENLKYKDLSIIVTPACRPVRFAADDNLGPTSTRVDEWAPSYPVSAPASESPFRNASLTSDSGSMTTIDGKAKRDSDY